MFLTNLGLDSVPDRFTAEPNWIQHVGCIKVVACRRETEISTQSWVVKFVSHNAMGLGIQTLLIYAQVTAPFRR